LLLDLCDSRCLKPAFVPLLPLLQGCRGTAAPLPRCWDLVRPATASPQPCWAGQQPATAMSGWPRQASSKLQVAKACPEAPSTLR
jgi:hypothetical protein